ncbi:hypothetical protein AAG906_012918 [Vitis piasezkii]
MVQHFDHVFHHLTSATIKEHVPLIAQHGGKRQRGFMEAIINWHHSFIKGHYRRSKDAIFAAIFGATTSAVQALLLGVVQAPFKAHLSHHLSAVQAPLETPFFWAASRRSHAVLKHCRRLHGLDCIQQGCSPRGWRRERRCRC